MRRATVSAPTKSGRIVTAVDDYRGRPPRAGHREPPGLVYCGGILQGRLSLHRFVELTSTAAAKTFGLLPWQGPRGPGADAGLVAFHQSRV